MYEWLSVSTNALIQSNSNGNSYGSTKHGLIVAANCVIGIIHAYISRSTIYVVATIYSSSYTCLHPSLPFNRWSIVYKLVIDWIARIVLESQHFGTNVHTYVLRMIIIIYVQRTWYISDWALFRIRSEVMVWTVMAQFCSSIRMTNANGTQRSLCAQPSCYACACVLALFCHHFGWTPPNHKSIITIINFWPSAQCTTI